jgi:uncharacterized protein YjaG (DUF416 family)
VTEDLIAVELNSRISRLAPRARVAFAASCCERLLPNYRAFSADENWGSPEVLREGLDLAWRFARAGSFEIEQARSLRDRCEASAPDTEDFRHPLTSAALDAAVAICETLDCCLSGDVKRSQAAAIAARDTVYMFVQPDGTPMSDEWIYSQPIMKAELAKQRADLLELERGGTTDRGSLVGFQSRSCPGGLSNLGIALPTGPPTSP